MSNVPLEVEAEGVEVVRLVVDDEDGIALKSAGSTVATLPQIDKKTSGGG